MLTPLFAVPLAVRVQVIGRAKDRCGGLARSAGHTPPDNTVRRQRVIKELLLRVVVFHTACTHRDISSTSTNQTVTGALFADRFNLLKL